MDSADRALRFRILVHVIRTRLKFSGFLNHGVYIYQDGVARALKNGYSGDGHTLCTVPPFLTHILQGFLFVETRRECSGTWMLRAITNSSDNVIHSLKTLKTNVKT
jgi:hypothetical protein